MIINKQKINNKNNYSFSIRTPFSKADPFYSPLKVTKVMAFPSKDSSFLLLRRTQTCSIQEIH